MAHEFDGEKYEQASAHQKEWGARLIAELGLRGDQRVLDLGCGDGALTARITEALPEGEVIGIDASQGTIEVALQKKRDNLGYLRMDIDDLSLPGQFDVVFSNATLHWVRDHNRLLANVRMSLKEKGVLRFDFGGEGNCSHFLKVIREAMADEAFDRYFKDFQWPWYMPPVEEYEALARRAGFVEARVWGEIADRFFPDRETMIRWVDQPSLVPSSPGLRKSTRRRFEASSSGGWWKRRSSRTPRASRRSAGSTYLPGKKACCLNQGSPMKSVRSSRSNLLTNTTDKGTLSDRGHPCG